MNRLFVALLAAPLLTGAAAPKPSKDQPAAVEKKDAAAQPSAPATVAPAAVAPTLTPDQDKVVKETVAREVEKAKAELRDELRAELQGAQSAREFMETADVAERPKLDFLQVHGYLRFRADLFDHLDLNRDPDKAGYFVYPRPIIDTSFNTTTGLYSVKHGTLTSANMRLRLEPVLNVSEQIRVLSQIDLLDNVVLGSNPYANDLGLSLVGAFGTSGTRSPLFGVNSDRNSIAAKRAWAEVQTPLGLLSFGRMPSSWGVGILTHAGNGLDDDFGDTVDRIQFAIPVPGTPLGNLTIVPMWDYVASGITTADLKTNPGVGQPLDRDQGDDVRALGLKIVHEDTEDELRRKLEQGVASWNYGLYYTYRTQTYEFTDPTAAAAANSNGQLASPTLPGYVHRDAYAHTVDLWAKLQRGRLKVEAEAVGVYGQIGNVSNDPANPLGPVLLRQFGGVLRAGYGFMDGKLTLSGEWGVASADSNPGMGNAPGRVAAPYGSLFGAQYAAGDKVLDIRNFAFNPAYRVDMIFWREIMKEVTESWYLKPTLRWEMLPGLAGTASIVYSQALDADSTPSAENGKGSGRAALGIEGDVGFSYTSDDGFSAFLNYGVFQPLEGLDYAPSSTTVHNDISRAHAIRTGLAVKF